MEITTGSGANSVTYTADHNKVHSVGKSRRLKHEPNRHLSHNYVTEDLLQRQLHLYETGKDPEERDYHTSVHTTEAATLLPLQNSNSEQMVQRVKRVQRVLTLQKLQL